MEQTLAKFVHALRNAEVLVTPAETLDAIEVLDQIGLSSRKLLLDALSLTLAKSVADKIRFEACFEQFFAQFAFNDVPKKTMLDGFNHADLIAQVKAQASPEVVELTQMVLAQQRTRLALRVQQVAEQAGIQDMHALRDKRKVTDEIAAELGVPALIALQGQLSGDLATGGAYVRRYVTTEIKRYVDVQYELVADASGKRAVLEAALSGNLSNISLEYQHEIDRVVAQFDERLRHKYKRRHKRQRLGALDIRHMLRRNVAYDGNIVELAWRGRKKQQGTVYVLCDVSGSVARLSRFLLLLLHSLTDVLPDVRSFAFSNRLGEVTDNFTGQHYSADSAARAVEETLFDWGNGATDYGRALLDFRELVHAKLNNKATIIILGDARSNFYDPRADVLKDISRRVRQVLWLNPEPRDSWGEGDSEMLRYAAFCLHVHKLATLQDLERVTERLLTAARI